MKEKLMEDPIIVIVLLLGFGFLFAVYFCPAIKTDNNGIVIGVISFMSLVLNYRYGSSKGSSKKDEAMTTALTDKNAIVNKAENVNVTT